MIRARFLVVGALASLALATLPPAPLRAATITIVNLDGPGEGINDPTPAAPVGGNAGATVGQQRLNVFTQAARIWGAILPSAVPILVNARFDPLSCSASPEMAARLAEGGVLVLAGLLETDRGMISTLLASRGFRILEEIQEHEWIGIAATQPLKSRCSL